ncbi:MAG TPA: bifunctional hexulose-6-phosphate synthase/ribonuclease regulator [Candidatus Altiarchaeales archaeon]|nr:bifunctional hexulose-6-phosphate synthase/ribonuclease regulator [Candidatus Altiarchaeales archaeon]
MKPVLQVALDFMNLKRALRIAKESVEGGVDWIEAGTPLIKAEGLNSVRKLRELFPEKKIVADMKTMDVGRIEVEMAAKAGADIVIVMGITDDSTIREAVDAGKNYGAEIMVDLMSVENMEKRAKELERMGVDYICVHVSIDQQMRGMNLIEELKKISIAVNIPVAIAGGLNSETAADAVNSGATIVIVGGAITKAEDARKSTERIKKAMRTGKPVNSKLYKKYVDPSEVFQKVSTANISDAMHRSGFLEGIMPRSGVETGTRMVGRAVTVRTYPGDWAKPVEAIDIAKEGEVIVIDCGGTGDAVWGELASQSCLMKRISGVVINGSVRDIEDIERIGFPVYSKSVKSVAGEPKGLGEINIPIKISGNLIRPGDYIIGDMDGVVVVPKEKAIEIANRAMDVLEKENRIRGEIKRGSTLSKVTELRRWEKKL